VERLSDVDRFDERAASYESGRLGGWHRLIANRTAELAASVAPEGARVLDVGCGTGLFLRALAGRLPAAADLIGIDPAEQMLAVARVESPGLELQRATAEQLPFPDRSFDLVASTLSFDHWRDQRAGLADFRRVLHPEGTLLLADLFAAWLWLTTLRRRRARTRRRAEGLLAGAGFGSMSWERIFTLGPLPLVQAVIAV
jgi:ubiquinone/menaquinone biosynthesis C-methylase UbiE